MISISFHLVPTLCVGTPLWTLCVHSSDAERRGFRSYAERRNERTSSLPNFRTSHRLPFAPSCLRGKIYE